MKKDQAFKTACVALVVAPLFLTLRPANAGNNGQMLQINTGWGSGSVKVEGYNQSRNWKVWQSGASGTAYTNNWWWKGYVRITVTKDPVWWRNWGRPVAPKTCDAIVPEKQWSSDWYTVNCQI